MSDVLLSVIQQLMNLAWFCRKINIHLKFIRSVITTIIILMIMTGKENQKIRLT